MMRKLLFIIVLIIYSCSESNNEYEYIVKDQDFRTEVLINNSGNYIELENGYTYFEEANQDSDTGTVVLVHGFSVPSYILETTFNSIKNKGFRVIMMDLYGRGFSDNPRLPQTDELRASQVIELLDKRDIEYASFVGLSNGGRIISKIAYLRPNIVKELFYIASSGFYEYPDLNDRTVTMDEINDLIKSYPEMAMGQKNDFLKPDQYPNWVNRYKVLQTFTFWGEFDNVVIYEDFKDRLNKVLPERKEFFISNSGHLPHLENQEEFENIFFKYLGAN